VKRNKNDKLIIGYIIHYSTLKINHTVKLVKLFEKVFMSSIILDNSLETLFLLINAVVDESLGLPATPI